MNKSKISWIHSSHNFWNGYHIAVSDINNNTTAFVFVKQAGSFLQNEKGAKDRHGTNIDKFPEQVKVQDILKIDFLETA